MKNFRKTGYVYDPIFLKHTQIGHPENAGRLEIILAELESSGLLESLIKIPGRAATHGELVAVHSPSHIDTVREASERGRNLDPDTYTTPDSYDAAVLAAGSVIALSNAVLDGQVENGCALVRPPGHHATPDQAMGFCNTIAIAAKALQQERGLERIAIIDFDVHHGNGTQDAFAEDPTVFYCSIHQHPHYPGSGRMEDAGKGAAQGTIVNFPLPAGAGNQDYRAVFQEIILPVARRFRPQFLLVSAGYDCHWKDPLAGMGLSLQGIDWITRALVALADEICEGRIVSVLEGGYHPDVLKLGVANSIRALLGQDRVDDPFGASSRRRLDLTDDIRRAKLIHELS